MPAAGRVCAAGCAGGDGPERGAGDVVAGGAVPVYRFIYGRATGRDADAVCIGAGDVGDGAIPRRAEVGECAVVYAGGDVRDVPEAGWRAGGDYIRGGFGDWVAKRRRARRDFDTKARAHGGGLRSAGADSVCDLDGS